MFNSGEMFQSDELENRWFRVIEIFAERFLKNIGQKFWLISYELYAVYLKYVFRLHLKCFYLVFYDS